MSTFVLLRDLTVNSVSSLSTAQSIHIFLGFQLTLESPSSTLKALKLYPQETVMLEER